MAATTTAERRLLLAAALLLLSGGAAAAPCSADGGGGGGVRLHFYMHDGPPTSVRLVRGPGPAVPYGDFGDTFVMDNVLTAGPSMASSRAVGRAQGTYVMASLELPVLLFSMTLCLTDGPYSGSTVAVAGRDSALDAVRELAVVGGTGLLRGAAGYVVWKTAGLDGDVQVLELDVHATVPAAGAVAGGGSTAE